LDNYSLSKWLHRAGSRNFEKEEGGGSKKIAPIITLKPNPPWGKKIE